MDAEREREIRDLAARLIASKRHRKIGLVLTEMLEEIDEYRAYDETGSVDWAKATRLITAYGQLTPRERTAAAQTWSEAARRALGRYAAGESKSPGAA